MRRLNLSLATYIIIFKHIPLPSHKPFNTYLWICGEKFCNYIFGYSCFAL